MTEDDKALVERMREMGEHPCRSELPMGADLREAADRIEALSAENERLREALELADAALSGANMNMNVVERKVRAALGDTK